MACRGGDTTAIDTLGVTSGRLRGAYAHPAGLAMHGHANWLDDDATRDNIEIEIEIEIDIAMVYGPRH